METEYFIENGLRLSADKTVLYGPAEEECPVIIELPDTVEVIEENAFDGHKELMKITLGKYVKVIGDKAFYNTGLRAITIPQSVEHIGRLAIECECKLQKGNKYYETDGRCLYRNYSDGKILHVCFKKSITEYEVAEGTVEIHDAAFSGCSRLRQVRLPDSVTKIGDHAFADTKIETFHVSAALTYLGNDELEYFHDNLYNKGVTRDYYTSTLISVDADNPIYWADTEFFVKKDGDKKILLRTQKNRLINVIVPDGITHIRADAFRNQDRMEACRLPDSLKEIGENAFAYCEKIESIVIPEETEKLCAKCFAGCNELKTVTFEGTETEIAEDAFDGCKTQVLLIKCKSGSAAESFANAHDIAVAIDGEEFEGEIKFNYTVAKNKKVKLTEYIGNAREVTIPSEIEGCPVTAIHKNTFRNNSVITKIIWPQELPQIPKECFWGCINLEEVEFPMGVELTISDKAFYNCRKLSSVRIPANVTHIGENAFGYAQLNSNGLWIKGQCVKFIYGIKNTAAMKYAEENNIIFVDENLSEEEQYLIKTMTCHEVADGISLDRFEVFAETIIGKSDTFIEKYAKEHNIPFITE